MLFQWSEAYQAVCLFKGQEFSIFEGFLGVQILSH